MSAIVGAERPAGEVDADEGGAWPDPGGVRAGQRLRPAGLAAARDRHRLCAAARQRRLGFSDHGDRRRADGPAYHASWALFGRGHPRASACWLTDALGARPWDGKAVCADPARSVSRKCRAASSTAIFLARALAQEADPYLLGRTLRRRRRRPPFERAHSSRLLKGLKAEVQIGHRRASRFCRPWPTISTTSSSSTSAPWPRGRVGATTFTPEALAQTYGGRLAATHLTSLR